MTTDSTRFNETMMNDWLKTQQKYWEAWRDFAGNLAGGSGNGQSAANPFAAFGQFASHPFAQQNPFTQNPFAQNPFMNGAYAQGAASNPFQQAMEQWWSMLKPHSQGDMGTVAQRFFDMGRTYMSMADGLFHAAGHEQPDAAMQMWMTGMQAALQQWISQVQNNLDIATPDLPGVSGTTLTTWAQLADSVAPWLNMSQEYLKDIAAGHLPGGIEMPGVGAAQEQFCRALSVPGMGYTREQQEGLQELARHLLTYHDALRAYKIAFGKTALESLNAVQKRLQQMHVEGENIQSLRALYDMWVDASEEAYAGFAMSDEYQVVYGDLVNALMQVRLDLNKMAEHQYELLNIPTRSEIDTMQHRQQENRRENRQLRQQIARLQSMVERLEGATPARAAAGGRGRAPGTGAAAAGRKAAEVEDDLTAIKGIGPKMMEKLYEQGIKNFSVLADMNTKFAEELDETLKTQGRILRDDWIGQARKLRG